jgi:hypothetical protein
MASFMHCRPITAFLIYLSFVLINGCANSDNSLPPVTKSTEIRTDDSTFLVPFLFSDEQHITTTTIRANPGNQTNNAANGMTNSGLAPDPSSASLVASDTPSWLRERLHVPEDPQRWWILPPQFPFGAPYCAPVNSRVCAQPKSCVSQGSRGCSQAASKDCRPTQSSRKSDNGSSVQGSSPAPIQIEAKIFVETDASSTQSSSADGKEATHGTLTTKPTHDATESGGSDGVQGPQRSGQHIAATQGAQSPMTGHAHIATATPVQQ